MSFNLNADAQEWSPGGFGSPTPPTAPAEPEEDTLMDGDWDADPSEETAANSSPVNDIQATTEGIQKMDISEPEPSVPDKKSQEAEKAIKDAVAKEAAKAKREAEKAKRKAEKAASKAEQTTASPKASKQTPELKFHDDREHLNIVFIGHVDAGKSTISGQILYITGQVDSRTVDKYRDIAKSKNRESWWIAYVMDTSEEERNKGKTVEVGRALFETVKKRYTILDAPGHKNYVPAMISGAAQADVGVLVISARKGEFEAGFSRGGQTREHAMLAKTLGISKLVIAINKMDEETVQWSKERYDEIIDKLVPFLKTCGYNTKKGVIHIPISGLTGIGLKDRVPLETCPWYGGPSLLETLDNLKTVKRDSSATLRVPIIDKYKDMGCTVAIGKVESGTLVKDASLVLMPSGTPVQCVNINLEDQDVGAAKCGENVNVFLKGVDSDNVHSGDVLCQPDHLCPRVTEFEAQMVLLELLEHKPILTAGYLAVFHCHTASVECEIMNLISEMDKKTQKKKKRKPTFVRSNTQIECRIRLATPTAVETYKDFAQLGRFTLRDEGKTIGIGMISKIETD
eukprot:57126_1